MLVIPPVDFVDPVKKNKLRQNVQNRQNVFYSVLQTKFKKNGKNASKEQVLINPVDFVDPVPKIEFRQNKDSVTRGVKTQ